MATGADSRTETRRAAIYARVSGKSQNTEDKTSLSEQVADMEAHYEHRGLTITARYQEVGRGCSTPSPDGSPNSPSSNRHKRVRFSWAVDLDTNWV